MFFFPWILSTQLGCIACSKIVDEPIGPNVGDSGSFDTGDTEDTDNPNDTNDTTDTQDTDTQDTNDTNDTNPNNDTGGPVTARWSCFLL